MQCLLFQAVASSRNASAAGDTVHLNAGTFNISSTIIAKTGVTIEGTSTGQNAAPGESSYQSLAQGATAWAGSAGAGTAGTDYLAGSMYSYTWRDHADGGASGGDILTWVLSAPTSLTLNDLVDEWSGNQANNAGMILIGPDLSGANAKSAAQFRSGDHATVADRPQLIIDYNPIPEPASALLLALGFIGTALLRRGWK